MSTIILPGKVIDAPKVYSALGGVFGLNLATIEEMSVTKKYIHTQSTTNQKMTFGFSVFFCFKFLITIGPQSI
ncbi:MAG: hypothetical protein WCL18_05200 [bacterium]